MRVGHCLSRFIADSSGNFAMIAAIVAPAMFGMVGLGIDYSIYNSQRSAMQEAADAAALAAVREAVLNSWNADSAADVAKAYLNVLTEKTGFTNGSYDLDVSTDSHNRKLRVEMSQRGHGYFLAGMFMGDPQIRVVAEAANAGGHQNTCVISLERKDDKALQIKDRSVIVANDCGVYANSEHPKAISLDDEARLSAGLVCSAGGVDATTRNIEPAAITDCPPFADPLSHRDLVDTGKCRRFNNRSRIKRIILRPGTYCDDMKLEDGQLALLLPGIYTFRKKLEVKDAAILQGKWVTLQFAGSKGKFDFDHDSTIELSAPRDGPTAGLVILADRIDDRKHVIDSQNANRLVGAVYVPVDELEIGGDKDGDGICDELKLVGGSSIRDACQANIGSTSEWTTIIAREIKLNHNVSVVLNANYDESDIPLPTEISSAPERSYLVR